MPFHGEDAPSPAELLSAAADALHAVEAVIRRAAEAEAEKAATPEDEDPMLTIAAAAAELCCSTVHVRTQCREGRIRALRMGRTWRIRTSELARYERRRSGL